MNTKQQSLVDEYVKEFVRVNGKAVTTSYSGGWFTINGTKYRATELKIFTQRLKDRPDCSTK